MQHFWVNKNGDERVQQDKKTERIRWNLTVTRSTRSGIAMTPSAAASSNFVSTMQRDLRNAQYAL